LHQDLLERDVMYLDAPISGGPAGADAGNLAIWVGGDQAVFERELPVLRAFSNAPQFLGAVGTGTATKLAHNLIGELLLQSLAEGFSLAMAAGLEPGTFWSAISGGLVGRQSPLVLLGEEFLTGTYDVPVFALRLAHKDATLALGMARDLGVQLPFGEITLADLTTAMDRGLGEDDYRRFLELQLERAGVSRSR
jgi:3-hydroxyisobutyrate dehydrogenase